MYGISPKLPLLVDAIDGHYGLTKTLRETVQQNLKNLMLTVPGERVMDSFFGVGLKKYLFENITPEVTSKIEGDIITQVRKYMSFLSITRLMVGGSETEMGKLNILIEYQISNLGSTDKLFLTLSN